MGLAGYQVIQIAMFISSCLAMAVGIVWPLYTLCFIPELICYLLTMLLR